jgi:hypothetical protein
LVGFAINLIARTVPAAALKKTAAAASIFYFTIDWFFLLQPALLAYGGVRNLIYVWRF